MNELKQDNMFVDEDKTEHVCPVCSTEFHKKIYKYCQAVYCCQTCAYKGRSLGFTTMHRFSYVQHKSVKKEIEKMCLICLETFYTKKDKQKYCSRECFEVSHKVMMRGAGNPAFIDGRSFNKRSYRGANWEEIRLRIYRRDNFTCQDCGIKCESKRDAVFSGNVIQCHHIEKYSIAQNNSDENLVTLCLDCHSEADKFASNRSVKT